jgi:periplasmic mercuric ion binding protein
MTKIFLIILIFSGLIYSGCKNSSSKDENSVSDEVKLETATLDLPTLQCSMCKKTIENEFKGMEGVEKISVSVKDLNAEVKFDPTVIKLNDIEEKIVLAGYDVNGKPADKTAYNNLHDCCKKLEDREDKSGMH